MYQNIINTMAVGCLKPVFPDVIPVLQSLLFGDKEILNLSSSSLPISLNKNMVEQNKKPVVTVVCCT